MNFLFALMRNIICTMILLGGLFFYMIYIEPNIITMDEVTISYQETTSADIKIIQFSDTHLGFHFDIAQLEKVVEKINAQNPDIVVFTGDLIDHAKSYEDIAQIGPVLAKIQAPLGKFAVYGNHDYGGGAEHHYNNILQQGNFILLVNETISVNPTLSISGLDEAMLGNPDIEKIEQSIRSLDTYHVLITHEPDIIDLFETKPNLTVAGHSHGGQVRLPFYGPLITTALGEKYVADLYTIDLQSQSLLYVNRGLGTTKLPMRFANFPVITTYHIQL